MAIIAWLHCTQEKGCVSVDIPAEESLDSASKRLPSGVYTTFRTYEFNKVLEAGSHFERLLESARLKGTRLDLDQVEIRKNIRVAISSMKDDCRIRLHVDLTDQPGDVYILIEPLVKNPEVLYRAGAEVITVRMHRENALAKSTDFIQTADRIRKALPNGVQEAVMVSEDGVLLEGLSSNFFAVIQGAVWTAGEGVLAGITRKIAIEAAARCGIELVERGVQRTDVGLIEEAFITSASRGVMPVTRIDDSPVGDGVVGPLTKKIMAAFQEVLQDKLESI